MDSSKEHLQQSPAEYRFRGGEGGFAATASSPALHSSASIGAVDCPGEVAAACPAEHRFRGSDDLARVEAMAMRLLELQQRFEAYVALHEEELKEIKVALKELRKDFLLASRNAEYRALCDDGGDADGLVDNARPAESQGRLCCYRFQDSGDWARDEESERPISSSKDHGFVDEDGALDEESETTFLTL